MSPLVEQLSRGRHRIEVTLRPSRTMEAFRESLDDGFIHVTFLDTKGGTELVVPVDRVRSDLSQADFGARSGSLTLVGDVSLDFTRVTCVAEVSLPDLTGEGFVKVLVSAETR